ncbi:hypothetical protein [Criblamydia sequanensis]|uniref:Conserved putative secreted protein n=1 Tax=Candidatus Criblamydia sequanensis CRIB-18 TaxID=1437425 RepID=A0A090D199_9BACT|nr:hypothetical protein [Criblamydia sequanensis]CDR33408.1 Conserved putative secreted protein [Criblamydia sequanensis CRIB-18]
MKNIFLILVTTFVINSCFADRYIQPLKYEDQNEILVQGGVVLQSKKVNTVAMYQTSYTLQNRKGNFYFSILNETGSPINFYFTDLKVTDQNGRPVKVLHKNELISNKRSDRDWNRFMAALDAANKKQEADKAGTTHVYSKTTDQHHSNFGLNSSQGWAHGYANEQNESVTTTTIQNAAIRQQALKEAEIEAYHNNLAIEDTFQKWVAGLSNHYFDSSTIFPGQVYESNFQIEVPKRVERDLKFLIFYFKVGEEVHPFCYYLGQELGWFE